ncbi:unnamed protein product [Notodromas monacha]|uniref:Phosphorylase b kinase regulatory subunit n=1 Tax=Notodromas monacha TaxID=399045 RepID=A0A7R9BGF5_9CRUS|nr:unnamed protein product [Notodromas monacha]CAG0913697.1 unnamed protein product [Notodromas monacha]
MFAMASATSARRQSIIETNAAVFGSATVQPVSRSTSLKLRTRSNSGVRLDYYQRIVYRTILAHQDPVTGLLPSNPGAANQHAWVRDNVYSILAVWALALAYRKNADLDEDRAKTFELEQDYGIWERGDKTNHGLPELNASSIGMAKAALEALSELDLFGSRGGPASVIHVLSDEAQKCQAVLQSMLPRESNSKEVDSGLLSVIGFPAFAVDDPELILFTERTIEEKLGGRYGCKRFLRDGHKNAREDPNRLYYEPWELRIFDNIENEWPLFYCYMAINALFFGRAAENQKAFEKLDELLLKSEDGVKLVPEMFMVPLDKTEAEKSLPHSQNRVPVGRLPYMWAQSLYIVACLLKDGFVAIGELDPLNRRLGSEKKPDVVVQVVILAEEQSIQDKLKAMDIQVQTVADVQPIEIQPARVLSHLYTYLGYNKKLGLSGRKSKDVGILSTSKLYSLQGKNFAFMPQFMDERRFYIASDFDLLLDILKNEINFLQSAWQHQLGRPLVVMTLKNSQLDDGKVPPAMIATLKKLKSGYINGTRVSLGNLEDFLSTSALTDLSFLGNLEDGRPDDLILGVQDYLEGTLRRSFRPGVDYGRPDVSPRGKIKAAGGCQKRIMRKMSVRGSMRRTRSIAKDVDQGLFGSSGPATRSNSLPDETHGFAWPIPAIRLDQGGGENDRMLGYRSQNLSVATGVDNAFRFAEGFNQARGYFGGLWLSPEDRERLERFAAETGTFSRQESQSGEEDGHEDERDEWSTARHRTQSDAVYENTETEELLSMLKDAESLEEQGDILHYLVVTVGLSYVTGNDSHGLPITVKDLLKLLYEKACREKQWALVRHSSGMLGKRVEDLAKAVTDLLVRQKQVTVGMPPMNEKTITAPLPSDELTKLIQNAYGDDESSSMLTQELLVYLAMFIRTEPNLFSEVLRMRVGLIIQVMASELGRVLKCSADEASDKLLNLSPFEMKNLLHHIMSGKEFGLGSAKSGQLSVISMKSSKVSKRSHFGPLLALNRGTSTCESGQESPEVLHSADSLELLGEKQGQWLRRRRLDGALNRVPKGFYSQVYKLLVRCQGLAIEGKVLPQSLTQEMTAGELKFALHVETVLNTVPQPEYRQLVVEAMMVLTLLVEHHAVQHLGGILNVEQLVHAANQIFLEDQRRLDGDATLCCASGPGPGLHTQPCNGAAYICTHFYDSAPSGCFGTMSYLIRAVATTLDCFPKDGEIDCNIS